jgi:hypothetical protein
MGKAALALHEATGEAGYLEHALIWQRALEAHYANAETGGYYLTADDAEGLVVRPQSVHDDATPNHNGVIAQNLARLAVLSGDEQWRARLDRLFDGLLPLAAENFFGHLSLLNALDLRLHGTEIVITGQGPQTDAFIAAAHAAPLLNHIVLRATNSNALPPAHPARVKALSVDGAAAFVCQNETCSLPLRTPGELVTHLFERAQNDS